MSEILNTEIAALKKGISEISIKVEENLKLCIKALSDSDDIIAEKIINSDLEIDKLEIEIEEICLKILALHQPVAIDLRYIIAVLKINNDLERIGDLTSNIAQVIVNTKHKNRSSVPSQINEMSEIVSNMLKESLDSFFNKNIELALNVQKTDDKVDDLHSQMFNRVQEGLETKSSDMKFLMPFLSISRYLERIADHCTNISEDVEYYISGKITRHHL